MKQKYIDQEILPDVAMDAHGGVIMNASDDLDIYPYLDDLRDSEEPSDEEPSLHFTIKIYKDIKFDIFKPLFPLKVSLFLWFGMGAMIQPFISMYLKQRGITVTELSHINIITPVVQLLGSVISGIVADKIGRYKPVLIVNLLLTIVLLASILLVPSMSEVDCDNVPVSLRCHRLQFNRLIAEASCGIDKDSFGVRSCEVDCPEKVTRCFVGHNLICEVLTRREDFTNFSLSLQVNSSYTSKGECFYNVDSLTHSNSTYSWCDVPHKMYCTISCTLLPHEKCSLHKEYRSRLFITIMVLMVLFQITFCNTYRFLDVTAMCLVKKHKRDFGRQRVWSMAGVVVFSALSGYIISATTTDGDPSNYAAAFYIAIALAFASLGCILWLQVHTNPPGKQMWKKSLTLVKNPDFLCFLVVLFILGAMWGFSKLFLSWFLVVLHAPSFLIGVIPAVGSIYGLPFLHTSNWWVKRIGTTNMFILALLADVVSAVGYSFLYDPWWSLALDATNVISYHVLWVAVILHSYTIAPEGLTATIIATAGGLHDGLGKGCGSLVGSLSMQAYGSRTALQIMAAVCLGTAVVYATYTYARLRCGPRNVRTSAAGITENPIYTVEKVTMTEIDLQDPPTKTNTD